VLFNGIRDSGEVNKQDLKNFSLEYAMMLDTNINEVVITDRAKLEQIKSELGENLILTESMNIDLLQDKLRLRYTDYSAESKTLMQSILKEVDKTVTFLSNETSELTRRVDELTKHNAHIEKHNENLTEHVEDYRRQIAEIHSSKTWLIGSKLVNVFRFIIPKKR